MLSAAEMREADRATIEDLGLPDVVLMESAGAATAREIEARYASARRIAILCGKGSNGGDGFVIARHLVNRGHDVRCYFAGALRDLAKGSDAEVNLTICRRMGIPLLQHANPEDRDEMARAVAWAKLLVDALLGTGLQGEVRPPYATLISFLNARTAPILAVDVPSGLDADTGEILGKCVRATRTATFGAPKVGFYRNQGPAMAGAVGVIDIGLPRQLLLA